MLLVNLEGMGIKMSRVLMIAFVLILVGCDNFQNHPVKHVWIFEKMNKNDLERQDIHFVSSSTIQFALEDYGRNIAKLSYANLYPFSAYRSSSTSRLVLIFNIEYVSDIQIVYEFNVDGTIYKKYMYSLWN